MKKTYLLSVWILLISLGISGQDFSGVKPSGKAKKPERSRISHQMLESYHSGMEFSLLKSAAEDSLSLDTAQVQFYLGEDQYLPIYNQRLYYDAEGNLARLQDELLNSQSFIWENSSRTDFDYDLNGNLSQTLNQDWDASGSSWTPSSRSEFAYNTANYLIQITESEWNESASQLVLSTRMDLTLDENNVNTQSIISLWEAGSSQWLEYLKYEYSYTVNNDLLEETEYLWDVDLSDWVLSWKAQLNYNESDLLVLKEEFEWDTDTETWLSIWKSEYVYETGSNVKEQRDSEYLDTETWQEVWKGEYTYDELNNPLTEVYSVWDADAAQLEYVAKYEYIYDQAVLLSDLLAPLPEWFLPDYNEQIVSKPEGYISYEYNPDPAIFEIYYVELYLYNPAGFPLGIKPGRADFAKLFPNPVEESLTINFDGKYPYARFELFDFSGRSLLQQQVENGASLNLGEIKDGVYLYRIAAGDTFQSGKLIKK